MKNINPLSAHEITVRPVFRYRPESVQARTPHAPWTAERVERLKALAAEGYSRGEIAKRLGNITRNAVIGKLGRLGVASKKDPRIRAAALSRQPRTPKPSRQAGASQRIGTRYSTLTSLPLSAPPKDLKIAPLPAPHADDLPRVSFMDLEPHHCRWPSGAPVAGFCGCNKVQGLPYCESHVSRAYTASTPRRQRLGEALRTPRVSRETYDWTDERIEILKSLWSTGKSASEISAQLPGALTRNAVIGKIHRLGLSTRKTFTAAINPSVDAEFDQHAEGVA